MLDDLADLRLEARDLSEMAESHMRHGLELLDGLLRAAHDQHVPLLVHRERQRARRLQQVRQQLRTRRARNVARDRNLLSHEVRRRQRRAARHRND